MLQNIPFETVRNAYVTYSCSLFSIVVNIADSRPKTRYLLAVDDSKNTLEEIVRVISEGLGTGKIQLVSKENALLNKDLSVSGTSQSLCVWVYNYTTA